MDNTIAWQRGIEACLDELAVTGQELAGTDAIQVLEAPPSPIEFLRHVAANRPLLIRNATQSWPAMTRWQSDAYLLDVLGRDTPVTVAVTPNGYADAVVEDRWFAEPGDRCMSFQQFIQVMQAELAEGASFDAVDEHSHASIRERFPGIHYIQSQNGNIAGEFAPLAADIPADIDFATLALDRRPDAVNFWMGTGRSVTSLHKDPYENIYAVVSGAKHFILLPPTAQPCLYEQMYERARYCPDSLTLQPVVPRQQVPWIAVDPTRTSAASQTARYPRYALARPLHVQVGPGDMLYLPAMWYHHVRQSGRTIAVNWWYDMDYSANYAYLMFVRGIGRIARTAASGIDPLAEEDEMEDEDRAVP